MIELTLTSANNGGVIDPQKNIFTLQILPNDNPYGSVEFTANAFTVKEGKTSDAQYLTVARK